MSPADPRDERISKTSGLAHGALGMLTREAVRAPLFAMSAALQAWQRTSGVREFARRRSNEVLQIAAHTPLGRFLPQPEHDDDADAEAQVIATAARETTARPKPVPAPAPAVKSEAAIEVGAPGTVTDQVERITEQLEIEETTDRNDLPIPDFDNVSLGSLRARLRSLSLEQLVTLREWEQTHAHRLPVTTLLDNRIAKVSAEQKDDAANAYPAGGDARSTTPTK